MKSWLMRLVLAWLFVQPCWAETSDREGEGIGGTGLKQPLPEHTELLEEPDIPELPEMPEQLDILDMPDIDAGMNESGDGVDVDMPAVPDVPSDERD